MVLALMAAGESSGLTAKDFHVPLWVVITSHTVIALGTLIGGWKVIRKLGVRMTKLNPSVDSVLKHLRA